MMYSIKYIEEKLLMVLSSEMDQAEIRLTQYAIIKKREAEAFSKKFALPPSFESLLKLQRLVQ
jgi:hypothetical protein